MIGYTPIQIFHGLVSDVQQMAMKMISWRSAGR